MLTDAMLERKDLNTDTAVDPATEPTSKATKKSFDVNARILTKPEKITTVVDGVVETTKNGKIGDYVLTGPKGEEYTVDPKTVESKYTVNKIGDNKAILTTKPVTIDYSIADKDMTFTASWGEDMIANPGDALVYEDGKLSYRIEKDIFEKTYDTNDVAEQPMAGTTARLDTNNIC
jgi:hypothetical protein